MDRNKKSLLFALLTVFFWSTSATAFKFTLAGMSFAQMLFYSSLASAVALGIAAAYRRNNLFFILFNYKFLPRNIVLGFINPFLYYIVLFKAYSILPAQEAQPLNYTWPIAISVFSVIFLKQKMSYRTVIGLITAFIGVVIIGTKGEIFSLSFDNELGTFLAVGSSLIWATYWLLKLIDIRESTDKLFGAFFFGTIHTAIYVYFFDSFTGFDPVYLTGAAYIGLFEMGLTFLFWMTALKLSESKAKTSTLAYLAPFLSMIFIAFVLGEEILISSIIGLFFIVGGILYQHLNSGNRNPESVVRKI